MNSLKVKRLHPDAILPTVAHPGEDLAYDLYALEDATILISGSESVCKVRTGIAASAYKDDKRLGLILKARSGMASAGYAVEGGVIDSRYTGEIIVLLTRNRGFTVTVKKGDKVAQAVPVEVLTGDVVEVSELEEGARGDKGFGSTGR